MSGLTRTEDLVKEDLAHVLHPVTQLYDHARQGPLVIVEGSGIIVKDSDGREYIDGMAALWNVNVGHGRKSIAEAGARQMEKLAFTPSFWGRGNVPSIELASRLSKLAPENIHRFFFTSGGAESNETAFKIARYYHRLQGKSERHKIIARYGAYHGISYGALSATGLPAYWKRFGPMVPGFLHIPGPYCYRCVYERNYPDCGLECADALDIMIKGEDPDTVAAFIGEPVMGVGGWFVLLDRRERDKITSMWGRVWRRGVATPT